MARRGRCRCGFVITFHRGASGYKARCPACGSVVRLRSRRRRPNTDQQPVLPSPAASPIPEDSNSVPWPVPEPAEVPAASGEPRHAPGTEVLAPAIGGPWEQAVLCPQCGSLIPDGSTLCPVCQKEPSWPPHQAYEPEPEGEQP
jgi:RNA polymerase subunit RPABC4/transcription elongation factor Spt4